ncbi:phospholipase [bacterium]|nr:phospholipase [bacterium]
MTVSFQECHVTVRRTGRYFVFGDMSDQLRQVWFVCHGYGQLASYFLKNFHSLGARERMIVAPEGLSRFYLQGFDGRIGASWMTREDRLNEIGDYVGYLDEVYLEIFSRVQREKITVFVLGFSQAAATVCRWLSQGQARTDKLILWAGGIPPELDLSSSGTIFRSVSLTLVIGKEDSMARPEALARQLGQLQENRLTYELIEFDGGHQLHDDTLRQLANG